ncbi:MAG: phosphoribosylamine--glycine ligase [Clostridia bacterium]|nr:phosphoribosylamine--glycine ligase [Clostridia bacterium]
MKILIVGSGGREHAIAWKLNQSSRNPELFAAPGNVGMMEIATCINITVDDIDGLLSFAKAQSIDLTVVGPEVPLVLGIVDRFEAEGLKIIGPNQFAAQFEGSKDFTKAFLTKHGIPTAAYGTYDSHEEAIEALDQFGFPVVIKADGLAAGKGVIIANDMVEARAAIDDMMQDLVFGEAGARVVIEEFLVGVEASILCFCDGLTLLPMQAAQDYKKAMDGDLGPNTGGMGTYSPSRVIDAVRMDTINKTILQPFIDGIHKDGIEFKGILFVGIMIDGDDIRVLEYNVRFGDPETEVTLPRLKNDLIDIFDAIVSQRLDEVELDWHDQSAVCVIMASGGYPENYEKSKIIKGFENVNDATVFHCGTKMLDGEIVTNGGRVLGVTSLGDDLETARACAYEAVRKISFEQAYYRNDIGK